MARVPGAGTERSAKQPSTRKQHSALPRRVGDATKVTSDTAATGGSDSERWPKGPRAGGEKGERRGGAGAGGGRAPAVPCGERRLEARALARSEPSGRAARAPAKGRRLVRVPILALGDNAPFDVPAPGQGSGDGAIDAG
eukprot:15483498-Alexandrium_andersonii.AAC.1